SVLVPHGAVRAYVMGERGAANEPATEDDIAAMAAIVREALAAGAVGLSTTRTIIHRAKDGRLAAGTTATVEELLGIGAPLGEVPGPRVFELTSDWVDPGEEMGWIEQLSRTTGCRVTFSCSQDHMRPDLWRDLVERAVRANKAGAHVVPQVGARPTSILFSLESSANPFMLQPCWAELGGSPGCARPRCGPRSSTPPSRTRASPRSWPTPGGACSRSATRPTTSPRRRPASPPGRPGRGAAPRRSPTTCCSRTRAGR